MACCVSCCLRLQVRAHAKEELKQKGVLRRGELDAQVGGRAGAQRGWVRAAEQSCLQMALPLRRWTQLAHPFRLLTVPSAPCFVTHFAGA